MNSSFPFGGIYSGPVLGRNPGVGAAETDGPVTGPEALWPHEGRKAADKIAKTSSNVFLMNVKISVFKGIITLIGYICNMRQYIVDAFAEELFTGNPAAVLPCREMPSPELMQRPVFSWKVTFLLICNIQ